MIDVSVLRKNPEILFESQKRRFQEDGIIKEAIRLDSEWRELLRESNNLKADKNKLVREIGEKIRKGDSADSTKAKATEIDREIENYDTRLRETETRRDDVLRRIPNIVDNSAPVARDDTGNVPVYFEGLARVFKDDIKNFTRQSGGKMNFEQTDFKAKSHVDLLVHRGLANLESAASVAGSRFYYLLGDLVLLESTLEHYALKFLQKKGFTLVEPPFMLNKEATNGATDFTAFEDTLYKVEGEDLYLIATSEHPIAAYHSDSILEESSLPLLYAGISPCFRREAGAHGKDTKGIFRVHQFNKIEQFAYVKPEDSKSYHNKLLENAKEFYRSLEIPFRVVDIATGDLGNVASRKFDIEAWYPAQAQFREVVSASNVLDYQARRLKVRYRAKEGNIFVHTLNSTLIATTRTLVAIAENNQQEDGTIVVPKVLRDLMGKEVI
ncbi:MAG: serine--tRNA ligase [Thermoplasmatales archaeon]|nr:serine--tRNA ligase [Candidatus Thermoplasmatota archaeon]MCL6002644.1 serine--tRNA ligase [Candidatus Thermoplasmatota archaeon]MDA8055923.1 serine--tRNA ligase [Thermoplasmatales archaeon]